LKLDLWFLGRLAIIFMALIILSIGAHAGQENPRVLLIDKMAGWDNLNYLRLLEISAQNGIELELATGSNANPKILDGGYSGIIVFGGGRGASRNSYGGTTGEQLVDLQLFTKKGGRFAFFALPMLSVFNDELRNLAGKELHESRIAMAVPSEELIAVNDALETLALEDPQAAEVVRMRYCVGMTVPETADARPPVAVRLPIVSKA